MLDENSNSTILCALNTDGIGIVQVKVNPVNHALEIDDNTTGSDNGNNLGNAMLDQNSRPVWIAESSNGDGTLVEVYGDTNGNLLVNSN